MSDFVQKRPFFLSTSDVTRLSLKVAHVGHQIAIENSWGIRFVTFSAEFRSSCSFRGLEWIFERKTALRFVRLSGSGNVV